ncbi:MAG: DNA polymerase I, partial [Nitrosomonadaceae bacterium]|nr:DNA polymerase I [Nitrosomonadaceae bacterium]
DIAQLVNKQVTLVNTMNNETLDEAGVLAKFGVAPTSMLDYLTLVGDKADNVPGVEKVGPKTAIRWLEQYGTLDNLIIHAKDIDGVVGENLRKTIGWLEKSRELLAIKCDVVLPVSLQNLGLQPQDTTKLVELYERLDFRTWLRELQQDTSVEQKSPSLSGINYAQPITECQGTDKGRQTLDKVVSSDYQTILTEYQLDEWIECINNAPLVSVDTETTGLDPMRARLVGISFSVNPHRAAYLPLAHCYPGVPQQLAINLVLDKLRSWLEDPGKLKLGQNLKYDKHIFANHGIALNGITHDTLLQSYVLESHRPHNMDNLALRHLDVKTISYDEVTGKGNNRISFDQVGIEQATKYAAEDADITLQLHQYLYSRIMNDTKLEYVYRTLEMPVLEVLFEMECNGVLLDIKMLEIQSRELGEKMLSLEEKAFVIAGQPFNLNSPKQIQEILFGRLKLPIVKKTPSGVPSTKEDVLQQLALDYPLPKILLDYRSLAKLKSTYTDKLPGMINPATGRIHTSYHQAVTATGRLSSSDPNLQNIPVRTAEGRRIRQAFIASEDCKIVAADYSQIELRIM